MATHQRLPLDLAWFLPTLTPQMAADQENNRTGNRHASTVIEYFGTRGELLFKSSAPASPGDGNLSFLGVVFGDARIARVKIIAGDAAPGPNDGSEDIVMMDDFLYGEPTSLY